MILRIAISLCLLINYGANANIRETSYSTLKNSNYCKIAGLIKDRSYLKSEGEIKGIFIPVDFPNIKSINSIEEMSKDYISDFKKYYSLYSYNKINIEIDVLNKWITLKNDHNAYSKDIINYTQEVINQSDSDINYSDYDIVYIIVPDNITDFFEVGPVVAYRDSNRFISNEGNVRNIIVGTDPSISMGGSKWRWMAHETAHVIGLEHPHNQENGIEESFIYSVMDFGWVAPGLYSIERWKLGWIHDRQIRCIDSKISGTTYHRINSIEGFDRRGKAGIVKISDDEILVFESRRSEYMDNFNKEYEGLLVYLYDNSFIKPLPSSPRKYDYSKPEYNGKRLIGTIKQGESISYNNVIVSNIGQFKSYDMVKVEIK